MRKSPHFRGLFSGESAPGPPIVTIAVDDGPLPVEFSKTTIILGATLLANDIIPNGATVISVQAFVGGTGVVFGGDVHWSQGFLPPLASSFSYTIQDNVTTQTSTATVTLTSFFPVVACVDDGPSFDITTEFRPLILSKFGGGTITANDTFGGASPANPVNVTVLIPSTPAYNTLFDTNVPGIYTLVIPPSINQIEIETWGAQGGRGGDLSAPGAANGLPQQVAGLGAHRLVTNLAVTPGQILSIAVGGAGGIGDTTAGQGLPNNIGTGGLGGQGFADNSTSPTGGILGTGQHDSFGFPDGAGFSALGGRGVCTNCDGLGGAGGSDGTPPNQPTLIVAPGGGGGAGSGVTVGDATTSNGTPLNRLGPVLNVAAGGGGGSGASVTDTSRGPGQDGGPPDPNRIPSTSFFGSNGQTAALGGGATGGGGGGYRGGHSFPQVDINTGRRIGFGGESNDERYKVAGERTVGNKTPSIQFGAEEFWPAFSGSTTTEFPSLQVGNGRVRIRGRTVVDQLGGTQFPIHCKVVDLGATIQITPDIPFNIAGSATNECSFFYFLTDTLTGETSGVCEVKLDIIANNIVAADDGPFNVLENSTNAIVASEISLLANDLLNGVVGPSPALLNVEVVSFSGNITAASFSGGLLRNLIVDTGAFGAGGSGTVTYRILDPLMPAGFELLANRGADTADVAINITSAAPPPFVDIFDTGSNPLETVFTIPAGVNNIEIICLGADGGLSGGYGGIPQGLPGNPSIMASRCGGAGVRVTNIPVAVGDMLFVATGSRGLDGTVITSSNTPLGGAGGLGNATIGNYNFPGGGSANGAAGADGLTGDFGGVFAGSAGGGGGGTTVADAVGVILCAAGGGGGGPGHSSSAGQSGSINCGGVGGEISSDGAPGVKTINGPLGGGGGGFRGGAVTFAPPPPADPEFGLDRGGDRGFQGGGQIDPGGVPDVAILDGRVIIRGRLLP